LIIAVDDRLLNFCLGCSLERPATDQKAIGRNADRINVRCLPLVSDAVLAAEDRRRPPGYDETLGVTELRRGQPARILINRELTDAAFEIDEYSGTLAAQADCRAACSHSSRPAMGMRTARSRRTLKRRSVPGQARQALA